MKKLMSIIHCSALVIPWVRPWCPNAPGTIVNASHRCACGVSKFSGLVVDASHGCARERLRPLVKSPHGRSPVGDSTHQLGALTGVRPWKSMGCIFVLLKALCLCVGISYSIRLACFFMEL